MLMGERFVIVYRDGTVGLPLSREASDVRLRAARSLWLSGYDDEKGVLNVHTLSGYDDAGGLPAYRLRVCAKPVGPIVSSMSRAILPAGSLKNVDL